MEKENGQDLNTINIVTRPAQQLKIQGKDMESHQVSRGPQKLYSDNKLQNSITNPLEKLQSRNSDNSNLVQHVEEKWTSNSAKSGMNTSIQSIESNNKEYTIYEKLEGLQNPLLCKPRYYEDRLRKFAALLEKHVAMSIIYHLTIKQLMATSVKQMENELNIYKTIQRIAGDNNTLKVNKIKGLKMLHKRDDETVKRILVAYIIYQFMGYNALLALDKIEVMDKEKITRLHGQKGAVKFNTDGNHIIKQTFAEMIGESRELTYELIKYHCYQTRLGESSYRNLQNQRNKLKRNLLPIIVRTPAELLQMDPESYYNRRSERQDRNPQNTEEKRTNIGQDNLSRKNIQDTDKAHQNLAIQNNKVKQKQRTISKIIDRRTWDSEELERNKQTVESQTTKDYRKDVTVQTEKESQTTEENQKEQKQKEKSKIRQPLRLISEPQKESVTPEYVQVPDTTKNENNVRIKLSRIREEREIQMALINQYRERARKLKKKYRPLDMYQITWNELMRHYTDTLVPVYMESLITWEHLSWLILRAKYNCRIGILPINR